MEALPKSEIKITVSSTEKTQDIHKQNKLEKHEKDQAAYIGKTITNHKSQNSIAHKSTSRITQTKQGKSIQRGG